MSQIRRGVRLPRFREPESDVRRRTVTKQDFVDAVADRAGMSKRDAGAAVDAVLETLTAALKGGDSVTFTGFGKFSTSARAARMGVNPRTGEKVHIAATTVPKFTAGSALKAAVKG
ncbi:MAG TPA: HU family DNA-binding protein [Gaiellaceae bacterium]|nr:HU family DNA-binding protein [Gaiellaceae bacterium]